MFSLKIAQTQNFWPIFPLFPSAEFLKTFDLFERVWYSLQALSYKLAVFAAFQPTDLELKKLGNLKSYKIEKWAEKKRVWGKNKTTNIITYYFQCRLYIFQHIVQGFFWQLKPKPCENVRIWRIIHKSHSQ